MTWFFERWEMMGNGSKATLPTTNLQQEAKHGETKGRGIAVGQCHLHGAQGAPKSR